MDHIERGDGGEGGTGGGALAKASQKRACVHESHLPVPIEAQNRRLDKPLGLCRQGDEACALGNELLPRRGAPWRLPGRKGG